MVLIKNALFSAHFRNKFLISELLSKTKPRRYTPLYQTKKFIFNFKWYQCASLFTSLIFKFQIEIRSTYTSISFGFFQSAKSWCLDLILKLDNVWFLKSELNGFIVSFVVTSNFCKTRVLYINVYMFNPTIVKPLNQIFN